MKTRVQEIAETEAKLLFLQLEEIQERTGRERVEAPGDHTILGIRLARWLDDRYFRRERNRELREFIKRTAPSYL